MGRTHISVGRRGAANDVVSVYQTDTGTRCLSTCLQVRMPVLYLRDSPAPLADSCAYYTTQLEDPPSISLAVVLMKFWLVATGVYLWVR